MTKKNTYIELWRFIFCCIILIHHSGSIGNANTDYLFPAGFLAVEFFFMLSGFFAMKHIRSYEESKGQMMRYSMSMTIRKMEKIFPYAAIGTLFAYGWNFVNLAPDSGMMEKAWALKNLFFELFFVPMTGMMHIDLGAYLNAPLWYLSVLLLALPLVSYLAIRFRDVFENYLTWIIPMVLHGYLITRCGLGDWGSQIGITYSGVIRGFADLLFGCALYLLSEKMSGLKWKGYMKVLFTGAELLMMLAAVYICTMLINGYVYEIGVWLMFFSLAISLSNVSLTSHVNSRLFGYLGKLSLPMYCLHWTMYQIVGKYAKSFSYHKKMALVFALCIICSVILIWLIEKCLTKSQRSLSVFFGRLFLKKE